MTPDNEPHLLASYGGGTRIYPIIGDPIAQVKSPITMTAELRRRGVDAVIVPIHVAPADVDIVVAGFARMRNVDGFIATVPHKFAAYHCCRTAHARAATLGAANMVRRNADGTWHGDMLDGLAFVEAARNAGAKLYGASALLVGAGGAGSAMGLSLLDAGVAGLAVHDASTARRDALIAKLARLHPGKVRAGSPDPTGFTVIANATPMGMKPTDPLPLDASRITSGMFVGDVVTVPEMTPLLEAARAAGGIVQTGVGMVLVGARLQCDFLQGRDG